MCTGDDGVSAAPAAARIAELAFDLARRWSDSAGRPVRLLDASLARPLLASLTPEAGCREGLSDAVLFGASATRVTVEASQAISIVPAGTPVGDGRSILEDQAWSRFWAACATDALAVAVVHLEQPGGEAVLEGADAVVVLGGPEVSSLLPATLAAKTAALAGPPRVLEPLEATPAPQVPEVEPEPSALGEPDLAGTVLDELEIEEIELDELGLEEEGLEEAVAAQPVGQDAPDTAHVSGDDAPDLDLDDVWGDPVEVTDPIDQAVDEVTEELKSTARPSLDASVTEAIPSVPDGWGDLGGAFSLREGFGPAGEEEPTEPEASESPPARYGPPGWAGEYEVERVDLGSAAEPVPEPMDGLVTADSGELRRTADAGPALPLEGASRHTREPRPAAQRGGADRPGPRPRATEPRTPLLRVLLLLVLLALLFAFWMGWIDIPGLGSDPAVTALAAGLGFLRTSTVDS
ncbi:MAG: hypothetical protein R3E10_00175 [Gemmatimonadota bacterium]